MWNMVAARGSRRPKWRNERVNWSILIDCPRSKPAETGATKNTGLLQIIPSEPDPSSKTN